MRFRTFAEALLVVGAAYAANCAAQPSREPVATAPAAPAATPAPPARYVFQDLHPDALVRDGRRVRYKPIVALIGDYTFFDQDAASLDQVGAQEDTQDLRAGRIGIVMRSKGVRAWEAVAVADYQERRTREDSTFQLYDFRFRVPVGRLKFDVGKQKQPFVYEVVGLSLALPQQERILAPFFVTRSIGAQISGPLADDRMTWAAGWFNDWLETDASFSDNANDYVARVTRLLRASPDDRDYLHLGIGLRRVGSDPTGLRFSGRPESNVADKYLDTGDFQADYAREISLELVWDRGPFALIVEHIESRAEAPASGNPRFAGSYLILSWILSGDSRVYNRALGYAGAVVPSRRAGAIELVARYSHLDLADGPIDGGALGKLHLGVNWWSSQQWKAGLSYGDADLDRDGSRGNTKMLLARLQWFY
jgi:phosphate-selective porin OprO/OprP